jgi:uncharacterized membrane protein
MENEKKYDTNPLDPEAARRAADAWGEDATRALPQRETLRQDQMAEEAPTRRFAGDGGYPPYAPGYQPPPNPYQTPYAPPQMPPNYQPLAQTPPAQIPTTGKPTARQVAGLNLPENILLIAPYIPIWVGAIAALVELFVVPRAEKRVRFHAAQGLAMHLAVTVAAFVLSFAQGFGNAVGAMTWPLRLASAALSAGSIIYFIIYLIKVWKGEEQPVEMLQQPTQWLQDNIAPRGK